MIPVGGVLADKLGPRTLMLAADAVRCVVVAALAVLAARHVTSLAALGSIAVFIGAGEGLFIPASFSIMPSLLDGERLTAGAAGYGALLACLALGGIAGTLGAARAGGLRAPAMFASAVFLAESVAIALVPYLGGEAGAAAMLCLSGVCNGLGNVIFLTVMQKWVAPGQLGRVMGVLMLCAFGSFPLSVAASGVLVRHLGPVPFFPLAGALVAVAMLFGLTQRSSARSGP
jgi:MFS family permease